MHWADVNFKPESIHRLTVFLTFSAFLLSSLLVIAWILDLGVWTRSITVEGPFQADEKAFMVDLRPGLPLYPIFDTGGDNMSAGRRSNLSFAVDNTIWTRAHTPHEIIKSGAKQSFSHWGNWVYFSPGEDAVPPSRIDATYEVRVNPGLETFLFLSALLSIFFRVAVALKTGAGLVTLGRSIRWWMHGILGLSWILLGFAIVYFGSILVAIYLGHALPIATIFAWMPGGGLLDQAMPFAAFPILTLCALGAACGWAVHFGAIDISEMQGLENRLIRFWSLAGLPIIVAFLLLATSAGGWNGHIRHGGMNYQSIAGLVPHSDAQGYYLSAFEMQNIGVWNHVAAQRPLAGAMRSALTLGGGMSYVGSIVLQTTVIACFLAFALRAILIWQGIWVAGAFLALAFGLIQPFLTTALTEPLGIIWSLLSFAFFIEALRTRSTSHALVGFAALCLALVTRMGSMFTIPFLMVWIVAAFATTRRDALRIAAICLGIIVFTMVVSMALLEFFAPNAVLAGNFSYVACGLARGTDWSECARTFADQIRNFDVTETNSFLYRQAAEAFWREPSHLFFKIAENSFLYVSNIPKLLLCQYSSVIDMSALRAVLLACLCIPGIFVAMRKELFILSFWLTVFISTIFSAALIFGDDGRRVLIVTYLFLAGFFALGFASPVDIRHIGGKPSVDWRYGAISIALMLLICAGATSALQAHSSDIGGKHKAVRNAFAVEVLAAPSLTGFLIVDDSARRDVYVPAVAFSEFKKMWELSAFQPEYGPLPEEISENLPLAFFMAPRSEGRGQSSLYFGPPKLLTDRDAKKWTLDLLPIGEKNLFFVKKAIVTPSGQREGPED